MTFRDYMARCACEYLSQVLAKHQGCVREAAREAGCNRTWFYKVMERVGIEPKRAGRGNRGNRQWQAMQ